MVLISEWLPNPKGSDTAGEWIELFNNGSERVSLAGWKIQTANGKSFRFGNISIGGSKYLVLPRPQTKLAFKNSDEKVFLYDASGKLADQSAFLGTAPEGKSLARQRNGSTSLTINNFFWAQPTPGAENKFATAIVQSATYPVGQPLNAPASGFAFWEMLIGSSALLSFAILFIVKKHESLSYILFGTNPEIR